MILFVKLSLKVSLAFHPDVPINSGVVTHMVRLQLAGLLFDPIIVVNSGDVSDNFSPKC